jgi:hypothetical protein
MQWATATGRGSGPAKVSCQAGRSTAGSPVQEVETYVPPVVSVVVPTGQAVHLGLGAVVVPPGDTVPMAHRWHVAGLSAVLPEPAVQMVTATGGGGHIVSCARRGTWRLWPSFAAVVALCPHPRVHGSLSAAGAHWEWWPLGTPGAPGRATESDTKAPQE